MFSISFLPWLLLLLGIVLAIPIVSFVETSRQKKALAAAAGPASEGEAEFAEAEGEEVFGDEAEAGFAEEGGLPSDEGMAADGGFGQPGDAEMAGFDDDAFK